MTIFGESAGGAGIYYQVSSFVFYFLTSEDWITDKLAQLIAKDGDNEDLYIRAIADSPSLGPLFDCTGDYEENLLGEVAREACVQDLDHISHKFGQF